MIQVYFPTATVAQLTTFLTNRTISCMFYLVTSHASGISFPTGVRMDVDEPDENWQAIKAIIVSGLQPGGIVVLGLPQARVIFASHDPGKTAGRLSVPHFWVNSDGTQTED